MISSNQTGGATFVITLNGVALTGWQGRYDKVSLSHDLHRCNNETVKLDRFQLPASSRYQGLGPKILNHVFRLYKNAGAAVVLVPCPSEQGRKCYKKFGFRKNAMNTYALSMDNFKPVDHDHERENELTPSEDMQPVEVVEDQDQDQDQDQEHEELGDSEDAAASSGSEYVSEDDVSSLESSGNESDASMSEATVVVSDSEEETSSTTKKPRTSGVAIAGYTDPIKGLVRRSSSTGIVLSNDTSLRSLNDENWSVGKCCFRGKLTGHVSLENIHTGKSYEVLPSRVPKAKLNLSYDSCMSALKTDACHCSKRCNRTILDPIQVADLRSEIYSQPKEQDVAHFLTEKLKATGGKYLIPVDGGMTKVCPKYYGRLYSVGLHRVKKAARLARNRKSAPSRKRRRCADKAAPSAQYNICYSFWARFFEQNCQRPNNEVRIFPVAKSYNLIYKEYFTPWFHRLQSSEKMPSVSSFMRARKHPDFNDVKERAKHTHARCAECALLKNLLLEGFKNGNAEEEYIQRRRLHDTEVIKWRELESVYKSLAVTEPSKTLVIMHDGTEALGLPRFTNRTVKNLSPDRFQVVPWLGDDLSAQRKDYVYTPKNGFPKDSNTLISQVHAMIRRAKSDYAHPRHRARKLVLIADSASENKNNTLFAYITDLVENKWFDEVELLFGPVGHTHNGVDACHKIHNQNVGGCASADIGHFVHNYPKGYSGQDSRIPEASFLSRAADWNKYYEPCLRKIAGFTKSKNDPHMVRGFRIARQRDNTVSLTWKMDPGAEKEWRGADGFGGTTGFYMLKSAPTGLPDFVPHPDTTSEDKKALKKLCSQNMTKAMEAHSLSHASMQYNHRCATEKSIVPHAYLEDEAPAGEWGRACAVGEMEGARGVLREIKDFWDPSLPAERSSLWRLPVGANGEHDSATNNEHHYSGDQRLMDSRRLALVRYADEPSQVVHHPNNNNALLDEGGWVEDSEEEQPQAGWVQEEGENHDQDLDGGESGGPVALSEANRAWRFEEDFSKCKVGTFCIGLNETSEGPSPYVFVGKVTSVNQDDKTFQYKRYYSTADSWKEACLTKPWHPRSSQDSTDENPHHSVMKYFKQLNKNNRLPKSVIDAVLERKIPWAAE